MAILTFGVGDVVTTLYALNQPGVVESNPSTAAILATFGIAGMIATKAIVFGVGAFLYPRTPHPFAIPLSIGVLGGAIVAHNLTVIVSLA